MCAGRNADTNERSTAYLPKDICVIVSAAPGAPAISTKLEITLIDTPDNGPENVGIIESWFNDGVNILTCEPNCTGKGTLNSAGTPTAVIAACTAR